MYRPKPLTQETIDSVYKTIMDQADRCHPWQKWQFVERAEAYKRSAEIERI